MFSPHAWAIAPFSLFPKRRDEVKTSGPRERTIGIVRKAHQKSNEDCIQLFRLNASAVHIIQQIMTVKFRLESIVIL